MQRALMLMVAALVATGFAATTDQSANSVSSATTWSATNPIHPPAAQPVLAGTARPVVHWDRFYDRNGNLLPTGPQANVGTDSLYFKNYYSLTALLVTPKSEVPNPTPESVGPAFAWQDNQASVGMDPLGNHCYEVHNTTLRRTSTADGTHTDYTIGHGYWACGTDGIYVYAPVGDTVFKYTLTGTLVSSTRLDVTPEWYEFSVANDTVWCAPGDSILHGYACSKFTGGSITTDATWNVGHGTNTPALVGWDGQYYYVSWDGLTSNTFKRFNADRTLSASGTVNIDTRGVMCKRGSYGVMVCHGESGDYAEDLRQMLLDSCAGKFAAVDTWHIGSGGHAAFPATDWYNHGYRAVLALTNEIPTDSVALGDSLARFVQLGGGVVEAVFADYSPAYNITGDWRDHYAPFTLQSNAYTSDSLATLHQPFHPVMHGVSALKMGDYITGNTHNTLRDPNCVCLAEYTTTNRCVAAAFDSAGQRAVSLGIYPLTYWKSSASGQWCRLMVNALNWAAVGPSVGVTAPNGGEDWPGGMVQNITWTQTANGVSDSIYYSTDAGSTWTGVAWFATPPSPLEYAWTVPNTPTTDARVKIVTWDADGGRVEDISDDDFTISATGIAQNNVLPPGFALYQPRPNPLVSGAAIRYALPRPARVELRIYDVSGALARRLVGGVQTAGYRRAYWDGTDNSGRAVAPGVYYCRLQAGEFTAAHKLVVRR